MKPITWIIRRSRRSQTWAKILADETVLHAIFRGREGEVPYGYSPVATETDLPEGIGIYEDTSALPLVYTYDSYIKEETFQSLNPAERQEAMLEEQSCPRADCRNVNLLFIQRRSPIRSWRKKVSVWKKTGLCKREGRVSGPGTGGPPQMRDRRCLYRNPVRGHRPDRPFPLRGSSITEGNILQG